MIPTKDFITALKFVSHASATKDVRYYLNGVLFSFTNDRLTLVSTDGHRLATATLKTEGCHQLGDFIVPLDDVKRILATVKPKECNKYRQVLFPNCPDLPNKLTIDLDNGYAPVINCLESSKYPDWQRVVPTGDPKGAPTIGINATYLSEACKALAGLTSDKYAGVAMHTYDAATAIRLETKPNKELKAIEGVPFVIVMPMRV